MEVSFVSLVRQLCKHQVETLIKDCDYLYQPLRLQGDHNPLVKAFQIKAYNALFGYLDQLARQKEKPSPDTGINHQLVKLLSWVILLLEQNQHEESQKLQDLVEKLVKLDSDKMESCLRFLLQLAGPGGQKKGLLGYQGTSYRQKKNLMRKHIGFDYLNSTQKYSSQNAGFMYYSLFPREIFESNGLDCSHNWQEIFSKPPGQGLSNYFRVKNILNDKHEKQTQKTLYGALTHRSVYNLDIKLGLPDLPTDKPRYLTYPGIPSPKSLSLGSTPMIADEGFLEEEGPHERGDAPQPALGTSAKPSSDDSGIFQSSDTTTSIWDAALSFEPSKHYTWETVGKHPGLQELPYLTESGSEAVDKMFNIKLNEMSMLCPSLQEASKVQVTVKHLVSDVLQLLIGVPSKLFLLDKEAKRFHTKDWICVSGLTPTSVDHLLAPFLECGNIYHRLSLLVHLPVHKMTDNGGHTYQAFIQAIDSYLLYYRAAVLSVPKDSTLLRLELYCGRQLKQMRFLSCLCHSDEQINDEPPVPLGLELLDYLYTKTVEMWDTEQYHLMLSIFQTACIPFTLYLQNWVFHGVCKDDYSEFMIKVSDNIVQLTGKENWMEGFKLQIPSTGHDFPEFLSGMLADILTCGQSLNLLRICCPQHFICNVNNNEVPQIRFFHSKNELRSLQQHSQSYFSRLRQIARQTMQAKQQHKEQLIEMKKDLAAKAHEMAASELKRINTELENLKKLQQEKKKKEFEFFKEQMEEAQQRKLREKERRKKEDELTEKELALMKAKAEMEAEIKEKIKHHYAHLSEQAVLREERALWSVRRSRLNAPRMEFLTENNRKWKTMVEDWKKGQAKNDKVDGVSTLPQDLDPNLPKWAKSALTSAHSVQQEETPADPNLPSWARHADSRPLVTIVDGADGDDSKEDNHTPPIAKVLAEEKLPSWAKKGISTVDGTIKEGQESLTDADSARKATNQSGESDLPEELPLVSHKKPVNGHYITEESSASTENVGMNIHRKQLDGQSISRETSTTSPGDVVIAHKKTVRDQCISNESAATSQGDIVITHKKQVKDQCISNESAAIAGGDIVIPHKKTVRDQCISNESAAIPGGDASIPHRKTVGDHHVSNESAATSQGDIVITHKKQVKDQCISNESAAIAGGDVIIPHKKTVGDQCVSNESSAIAGGDASIPHKKPVGDESVSNESAATSEGDIVIPHKKTVRDQGISNESTATSSGDIVIAHKKTVRDQGISNESAAIDGGDIAIPHKKPVGNQCISNESSTTSEGDLDIPHKKTVRDQCVSNESSAISGGDIIPHKKTVGDHCVSHESAATSEGDIIIPHKKTVGDQCVSNESSTTSQGDVIIARKKQVKDKCVSNESSVTARNDAAAIPHRKLVENQCVSKETFSRLATDTQVVHHRKSVDCQEIHQQTFDASPTDLVVHRKKKVAHQSVTQESSESTLNYRHSGIFISPLLIAHGQYEFEVPVLKEPKDLYSQETDMKDFSIRRMSGIFPSDDVSTACSSLSGECATVKTHNKMCSTMCATTESQPQDTDASKRAKFKQRNIHGHASDSTIQKLLYGRMTSTSSSHNQLTGIAADHDDDGIGPDEEFEAMFQSWKESFREPYNCHFNFESDHLLTVGGDLHQIVSAGLGINSKASVDDLEAYYQSPLSVLIQRSIQTPLVDQIKLVNKCTLDYFLTELSIEDHFSAMWRYLIMGEADFALNLTNLLFEKLSMNPHPSEILNPIFLNSIMNQAHKTSISAEDKYVDNLSFEITKDSSSTMKDDAKILECLNLTYKIGWPLNIIINQECHRKYRQLYLFLLQLRYAVWLLEQIWRQLKRDAMVNHVPHFSRETQFHRVQTFGHIMREFVKALQNFFVNQVLYISWTNFQKDFRTKVFSLNDLRKVHMDFLDASLKRSLFTSPANHMMAAIKNMFGLILAFYQTLRSHMWRRDEAGGPIQHPNFPRLLNLYNSFCRYAKLFYVVISALAEQNHEPHLQDLVLLLNYNNWFSQSHSTLKPHCNRETLDIN
ncbi:gamma-tubulin complex component 6-like [Argonauta hians]